MPLDPTTNIGKVRLMVADWQDVPILPDAVYQSVLDDNAQNLHRSTKICAQYLCGVLAQRVRQKMYQVEIHDGEAFNNYIRYLKEVILNPLLNNYSPIPYSPGLDTQNDIIQFLQDWRKNSNIGTSEALIHDQAQGLAF